MSANPAASTAGSPSGFGSGAWRKLTRPHPSITDHATRRRISLSAGLLVVLIPTAVLFLVVYAPGAFRLPPGRDVLVPVLVLLAFVSSYALVHGPRYRAGIVLLVATPLAAIWSEFAAGAEPSPVLLYFTLVPVLLAGLLLDLVAASILICANLLAIALGPLIARPAGVVVPWTGILDAFLLVAVASSLTLVGNGFLARSLRDLDAANERLRNADAFRLQLLNTVAHDLVAPLTPIKLQVHVLGQDGANERSLAVVRRNLDVFERLVNDVRDLAKLEAGKLAVDRRHVDLAELARHSGQAFENEARTRGLRLSIQSNEALPIRGDPDRLTQVLYNLLTNALKFTPSGGTIAVTTSSVNEHARVQVTDSGRGLEASEIDRLFRPFSQVHDRAEFKERGSGLGLFITKGLVEAHDGRIWVESEGRGRGCTFCVQVPLERSALAGAQEGGLEKGPARAST